MTSYTAEAAEKLNIDSELADIIDQDNIGENTERVSLVNEEIDPLVQQGALSLIQYHRPDNPIIAKSWGSSEVVFEEIASQLMPYHGRVIAEQMAAKLVFYAKEHAIKFKGKYQSNTIGVKLEVSEINPEGQFETGAIETQRIDGKSPSVDIVGSSGVEVRLTASGTATTSNRADVDAMFANVRIKSLWIKYEAPDKSELDGMANEAVMAALATLAEGGLSPEQIVEIMTTLEKYGAEGLLTPELLEIVAQLGDIQLLAESGTKPEIQSQIQEIANNIIESLTEAVKEGIIPPEIVQAVLSTFENITEQHGLTDIVPEMAMSTLEQAIKVETIKAQIQDLIQGENGMTNVPIELLLEDLSKLEGAELIDCLDQILERLDGLDLPESLKETLATITQDIEGLQGDIKKTLSPVDLQALEFKALIEGLSEIDFSALSPEQQESLMKLQEALDGIDVDNVSLEQIQEALTGEGNTDLAAAVQSLMIEVNKEAVQLALPQDNLNQVNQFLNSHEALVEAVVIKNVVSNLEEALAAVNPDSPKAQEIKEAIQEVIDKLEAGESLENIDPTVLEQAIEQLGDQAPEALTEALQAVEALQTENVVLSTETLESIQNLTGDLEGVVEALKAEGNIEAAEKIEALIETLQTDPANIKALAELSQLDSDALKAIAEFLPSEVASKIDTLVESVSDITAIQAEALAIKHGIEVQDIQNITDSLSAGEISKTTEVTITEAFADAPDAVKEALAEAIEAGDMQAVAEILEANPDYADAVPEAAKAEVENVAEVQSEVEAPTKISSDAEAKITEVLAEADIPDDVKAEIEQALADGDMARVEQLLEANPEVAEKIPEVVAEAKEVAEVQSEATVTEIGREAKADITEAFADAPDSVKEALAEAIEAEVENVAEVQSEVEAPTKIRSDAEAKITEVLAEADIPANVIPSVLLTNSDITNDKLSTEQQKAHSVAEHEHVTPRTVKEPDNNTTANSVNLTEQGKVEPSAQQGKAASSGKPEIKDQSPIETNAYKTSALSSEAPLPKKNPIASEPAANNNALPSNKLAPAITANTQPPTMASDPKAMPIKSETFVPQCCRPDYNKASGTKSSNQATPVVSYQVKTFKDGSMKISSNAAQINVSADMVKQYGGKERTMDLADSIARGIPPETLRSKPIEEIFKAVDAEHRAAEIKATTPTINDTSVDVIKDRELARIVENAQSVKQEKPAEDIGTSFSKAAKIPDDAFNSTNKLNSEQTAQTPKFRERRPSPKMAA